MVKGPLNQMEKSESASSEEDFNTKFLMNFLFRNKKLIGSFTSILFLFASLYSFTLKKVWQGEFQIVLKTSSRRNAINLDSRLLNFANLDQANDLTTEVGILESPSLLNPIYEYVSLTKNSNNEKFTTSFNGWKMKNLDIELEKGTSILNIAYRDVDKELILPVLSKMTDTYQKYSGRNKKRNEELTKSYLEDQIKLFKTKSSQSLKAVQEFAIEQDLIYFDLNSSETSNLVEKNNIRDISLSTPSLLLSNTGIENIRVAAANQIRRIDLQIKKINNLGNDLDELIYYGASIPVLDKEGLPRAIKNSEDRLITINNQLERIAILNNKDYEALQYIGSTIPALISQGLPQELKDLERELVETRSKYTEYDLSVIKLKQKRDILVGLLKERSIKYLEAEKQSLLSKRQPQIDLLKERAIKYLQSSRIEAEATMQAAMRPKGVILRYKELIREAGRDEATLINLENQIRIIQLEEAKSQDPWELITKPTLLLDHVAPSKSKIAFIGLILGFIFGILISFIKEKRSGNIYELETLENILKCPVIDKIDYETINNSSKNIIFFNSFLENQTYNKVSLIVLPNSQDEAVKNLIEILTTKNKLTNDINLVESLDNLITMVNSDKIYLIVSENHMKLIDVNKIISRIKLLNLKIDGILSVN
tara:strand:+ start:546 stop:2504 length:1959 start_codon:yes stop_codon:yes gene_type:complete